MARVSSTLLAGLLLCGACPALAALPQFTSTRALLPGSRDLPRGYTAGKPQVVYDVAAWDGGIRPVIAIDERNGWMEGSQVALKDPHHRPAGLSVQLFRSARGARADFGQFFSNAHPETIYMPGARWLGGSPVHVGDRGTIYRIEATTNRCPQHLSEGLSFVLRNGIFSTQACTLPDGDTGVRDLAARLLRRARQR